MSTEYFNKHPLINYDGIFLRNLMKKSRILTDVFTNATNFYPYIIEEGERIDVVAYNYYGDSNLDWLVIMSNDIIDPYYEWYLTTAQFERMIKKKYGSIAAAQSTILHYVDTAEGYIVSRETIEVLDPATSSTFGGDSPDLFDPVYAYDYEEEQNEKRKFIKLLDKTLLTRVTEELRILSDEY